MNQINKKSYFRFLVIMLMASTFLSIVFNNLPPFIRSHHLWTTIWGISLLFFYPKIFLNRVLVFVLLYGLVLFLATISIWSNIDDWNYNALFDEFYQFAIGVSVLTYFLQNKDYIGLAKITKWTIIFLIITSIMSIISSSIDPMYARNIIGVTAVSRESEREAILHFKQYGGGNYSTAAAFMCLFPIFIYYYKNIKISLLSKKQIIVLSIIIFLALLSMQIFGNILIAVVFAVIALLGTKKMKKTILAMGLFFSIIVIIPQNVYVNGLLFVSDHFEKGSELNYKFRDLALFIETGANIEENNTGAGGRAERYPQLMETFVKSPVLGCYFLSDNSGNGYKIAGAHLYWMNKLTTTGIIGFILFLYILYNFIKNNLKYFDSRYKFYYILASLSILSYGLIKAVAGRDTWYVFFIILPGLYYLPLLKKSNRFKDSSEESLVT